MSKITLAAASAVAALALVAAPAAANAVEPVAASSTATFTDATCEAGGATTYTITAGTDDVTTTLRLKDLGDGTGGAAETYYAADGSTAAPGEITDFATPTVVAGESQTFSLDGLPAGDYRWTVSGGTVTNAERRDLKRDGTISVPDCPASSTATFTAVTASAGGETTYTLTAGNTPLITTVRVKNLGDGTGGTAETFYAADGTPGAPGVVTDFATVTLDAGASQTFTLSDVPAGDYRWTVNGGVTNAERRALQETGTIAPYVAATFTDGTCDADGATSYTLTAGTDPVTTTIRVKNLGDGTGGTAETFYAADGTPGAPGEIVDFATVTVDAGTSQTFTLDGAPAGDYRWTVSGGVTNAERRALQQNGTIAAAACPTPGPTVTPDVDVTTPDAGTSSTGSTDDTAGTANLAATGGAAPSLPLLFLGGGAVLAGALALGSRRLVAQRTK